MLLARVVGPVWGARHAAGLSGHKVLELRTAQGSRLCAVDGLGAGPGEWVLVAHGSRVRDLTLGAEVADKDIIIAIVDAVDAPAAPELCGGSPMTSPVTSPAAPSSASALKPSAEAPGNPPAAAPAAGSAAAAGSSGAPR